MNAQSLENQDTNPLGEFFSQVSAAYDESILRAIPPYVEILDTLLGYIFLDPQAELHILELGCGTGNVSQLLAKCFPKAHFTLVDLSPQMLSETETKLIPLTQNYQLISKNFTQLQFEANRFDLAISSLALHHLLDDEKQALYSQIHQWLKPGGQFRCADHCLGLPDPTVDEKNGQQWMQWARDKGATEEELALWEEHCRQYDHYAPLASHFEWLQAAGFQNIDVYWRKLMWVVFGAQKR